MAISVIGAASAATYPTWVACNNTTVRLTKTFTAGLYRVNAIVTAENGTPSVSLTFKNSAGSAVYTDSTVDGDSGSSVNAATRTVYLSADAATLDIATASNTYVSIERIGNTLETTAGLQLFVYTTSQSITIDGAFNGALIIGGGGGGGAAANSHPSGSGGGSGYITTSTSITPGTYSLAVGAGGNGGIVNVSGGAGSAGGQTTFAGLTANGGNAGAATNGPNANVNTGGSGGGGQAYNSNQAGGNGGSNGSQGATGGNQYGTWVGGFGSGVAKPAWITTASVGGAGGVAANGHGQGGGFYGGGGGGGAATSGSNTGTAGSAAAGTGGGGGGAGAGNGNGGNGGTGALYLVKFA